MAELHSLAVARSWASTRLRPGKRTEKEMKEEERTDEEGEEKPRAVENKICKTGLEATSP